MTFWILLAGLGVAGFFFAKSQSVSQASDSIDSSSEPSWWTKYDSAFKNLGGAYGVDWQWLKAIALNESSLGQDARVKNYQTSSDGLSWGLMQVTLTTAQGLDPDATIDKLALLDPADYSITLAAQIIADNKRQFPSDDPRFVEWVIKRYYGSFKRVNAQRLAQSDPKGVDYSDLDQYWDRFQNHLTQVKGG